MGADSVRVALGSESVGGRPTTVAGSSLTRRAILTAIASLLDYAAQIAITLLVTPIVVGRLGASLYGVWEMLRQAVGYMSAADGRPMDALRLVVASEQANADAGRLRRNVGAALAVWLVFLPLVAIAGSVLVWLAPTITKVSPEMHASVRLACGLLVMAFVVGALAAVPEAVLRGMNLGYKRMGWQAALSVTGGLLAAGAVYAGRGVWGLGAAQLALATLTGICFFFLAKRFVPAFAIARPSRTEIAPLLRMSAWLTGGLVLTNLVLASDVLILGMVVSPAVVATYVLTAAAARMSVTLFNFTVGATTAGLGGLIGQQQYDRAAEIRGELVTLTWLFATVAGATVLVWNQSFVSLWVGEEHYAGLWANVLIVCMMVQTAFIRGDAFIIDAALRPRPRVIVTAIAAVVTIAATLTLTPTLGIVGLCLGIVAGRLPQTLAYPKLVASCLRQRRALHVTRAVRQLLVMSALFAGAAWFGQRVTASGWLTWIAGTALSAATVFGVALVLGLPASARRAVLRRYLSMGRAFRAR
ncbi:MAG: oligosaccharide flippase family protein [Gemmatimonadota bacterium]|nr:oligosaccharide flippase family protein [Gemmatimonadota bacterium]